MEVGGMKVAIAGYGQEGEANYQYWANLGADLTILDEKEPTRVLPENARTKIGADAFSSLEEYDLVIRTASLSPHKLQGAKKVWSATNEFFARCHAPIIGVTGTKGKGTTSTLIAEILKEAKLTVHLVGNIGTAALPELASIEPSDTVVFELSSFQLWDLEKSPQSAVVLMIEPDHQDIHASMAEYVAAKANIGKYQTANDLMVYHPSNTYSAEIAHTSSAVKKRFLNPEGACVSNGQIIIDGNLVCAVAEVGLIGDHNLENICAAITVAWKYTQNVAAIKKAVVNFKGLPHRLEFVRELNGVMYYNDSFSSAPGATVAAIRSFKKPITLICGGYDKQSDLSPIADAIVESNIIKEAILIGQTKKNLEALLKDRNFSAFNLMNTTDFKEIVEHAKANAEPGSVVLLSPGCASFDMFKNFYERGEQFKKIVSEL